MNLILDMQIPGCADLLQDSQEHTSWWPTEQSILLESVIGIL